MAQHSIAAPGQERSSSHHPALHLRQHAADRRILRRPIPIRLSAPVTSSARLEGSGTAAVALASWLLTSQSPSAELAVTPGVRIVKN
jgi:hypothetical protein